MPTVSHHTNSTGPHDHFTHLFITLSYASRTYRHAVTMRAFDDAHFTTQPPPRRGRLFLEYHFYSRCHLPRSWLAVLSPPARMVTMLVHCPPNSFEIGSLCLAEAGPPPAKPLAGLGCCCPSSNCPSASQPHALYAPGFTYPPTPIAIATSSVDAGLQLFLYIRCTLDLPSLILP